MMSASLSNGVVDYGKVHDFMDEIFGESMHAKRVVSLANGAMGLLHAKELLLHKLGEGLAEAKQLNKKHATKQIDRLLSNKRFDIWEQGGVWSSYVIGDRSDILVSLDWTDFAQDGQSTLALNLITSHGRATPLLWKTALKSSLKHNRARYEGQLLTQLKEILPSGIRVTVLADRGFADQKFFQFMGGELGFFYIIRIRGGIYVTDKNGKKQFAKDWLRADGRTRCLEDAKITLNHHGIEKFVCTKQKAMKDAWYLVSNRKDLNAGAIVSYYGKRWTTEPYFRDIKDQRFGMGLASTHISRPERRDRLFFIAAICIALLTLLGAAGESIGFDRKLKVNTVKTRTHSLLRQGTFYFKFLPNFKELEQMQLLSAFQQLLEQKPLWNRLFCVI
jgi:hypothetical protein